MGNWLVFLILGVLAVVLGAVALLNPFPASIAAVAIAGWSFLFIGVIAAISAFNTPDWSGRLWTLLFALVTFLIGLNLITEPLSGLIALTALVGVMFIVSGIFKLAAGFQIASGNHKAMLMLSGFVSLVLGVMIVSNFPYSAMTVLGILLGIQLISDGATLIALAFAGKAFSDMTRL